MSKKTSDPDFYKRMMEAKRLKKLALEQKQLHDQFGDIPPPPQIVIKTEAEQRLDKAFEEVKNKWKSPEEIKRAELEQVFKDNERKAAGL